MRDFRLNQTDSAHYNSFKDVVAELGRNKNKHNSKSDSKKEERRKEHLDSEKKKILHRCRYCKNPMEYIGGSLLVCKNEKCKGRPIHKKDKDGNSITVYEPSYEILKRRDAWYASKLFGEEGANDSE